MQASKKEYCVVNDLLLNKDSLKQYGECCQREMKKLMQEKITRNVTYYDLLLANERKLASYACRDMIVEAMESEDLKEKFPEYADNLLRRFKIGLCGKKYLEMSYEFLNQAFKFQLPDLIIREILQYLSLTELLYLSEAANPAICPHCEYYTEVSSYKSKYVF